MKTKEQLQQAVREHAIEYGSLPFWSWNDRLEEEDLRRQIRNMHDLGMRGFFMHARGGLETEYMGEDWFRSVDVCIDEAKKLSMEAWAYDENGWPSGFAGGKLLKDPRNLAKSIVLETGDVYPEGPELLGVYAIENGKLRILHPGDTAERFYAVREKTDPALCDSLDLSVTERFLQETHEVYKKRIPQKDFGTAMPGFFTDEPQYYRWGTVWSDTLPEEFEKAYGYSIFSALPAMFVDFEGAEKFRFDYWKLCHRLFMEHWIRPVYQWCDRNGCQLTGHAVEENSLAGQMWCCGGIMHFYEFEHIPGMDYLTRNLADDVASKQLGSARAQLGKKKALSEMFGCCGWDVSPRELKRIAQRQYVNGVNLMCSHLYAYSIRGQRKRDFPAFYSEHLPWQPKMAEFNQYFNNLGYLLSLGTEQADVLVIHPIHSAYLEYKRADDNSIRTLEESFHALSDRLSRNHVLYHWGDENMLEEMGRVEGSTISLGRCTYHTVIVPSMDNLDGNTARMLKAFLENGGRVWCAGTLPSRIDGRKADLSFLKNTVSFGELCGASAVSMEGPHAGELRVMCRNTEYGKLFYVASLSEEALPDIRIALPGIAGVVELDLETLEPKSVSAQKTENGLLVCTGFPAAGARLYLEAPEVEPAVQNPEKPEFISLDRAYTFRELPENALTLDRFSLSLDGGATWTEKRPLERIRDELLRQRYRGELCLKTSFTADFLPRSLHLTCEPIRGMELFLNGEPLTRPDGWRVDRHFPAYPIQDRIHVGENEILLKLPYYQDDYVYHVLFDGVSESLRNCLNFNTEIECLYLTGTFRVKSIGGFRPDQKQTWISDSGEFVLTEPGLEIDPRNLVTDGYPFFAGTAAVGFSLAYRKGDPGWLKLDGRFAACRVLVNGACAGTLLFENRLDLRPFLREGDNEVVLELTNSNRNLLGPHHHPDPEPLAVHPMVFSLETLWKDGKCVDYVDRYAFMRFGFDCK